MLLAGLKECSHQSLDQHPATKSLRSRPSHEELQSNDLSLVDRKAHEKEAIHCLRTVGVHVLAIVKEKLVNPEAQVLECHDL